jgi:hypothetical protein
METKGILEMGLPSALNRARIMPQHTTTVDVQWKFPRAVGSLLQDNLHQSGGALSDFE